MYALGQADGLPLDKKLVKKIKDVDGTPMKCLGHRRLAAFASIKCLGVFRVF